MTTQRLHLYTDIIPIRWRDVDPYQHVNHSVFFTYMEEARWQWFYSLKEKINVLTPIVDAQIRFKKPLVYPGKAVIKVYAEPPAEKSWTIYHEIYSEKDTENFCVEASVKFVAFDPKNKCVVPLPENLRAHLNPIKVGLRLKL